MKNFIVFAVFLVTFSSLSQTKLGKDSDLKVVYEFQYKKFVESNSSRTANTVLISKGQESLFTFDKMIRLDSVQKFRALEGSEVLLYRAPYFFLIKRKNQLITHHETIGNDLLRFNETTGLKWQLLNEQKEINTYQCRKAILSFEGRDWIAWYTTDIPVSDGPYKFHGLPGLIIQMKDADGIFEFTAIGIERGTYAIDTKVKNYFIAEENEKFYTVEKDKFYTIRKKFYEMSLNDRLKYMNREKEEGVYYFDIQSATGEKVRTNRKPKARNFIELNK